MLGLNSYLQLVQLQVLGILMEFKYKNVWHHLVVQVGVVVVQVVHHLAVQVQGQVRLAVRDLSLQAPV